jgi:hypothetical protein
MWRAVGSWLSLKNKFSQRRKSLLEKLFSRAVKHDPSFRLQSLRKGIFQTEPLPTFAVRKLNNADSIYEWLRRTEPTKTGRISEVTEPPEKTKGADQIRSASHSRAIIS